MPKKKSSAKMSTIEEEFNKQFNHDEEINYIKKTIDSFLKLFKMKKPGEIIQSIYNDLGELIRLTTSSGILAELDEEYTQKFKELTEIKRPLPKHPTPQVSNPFDRI
ncbi:MAG: hypothetical protein ACTSRC_08300 [Candidatus Helarchaeota archaeon]